MEITRRTALTGLMTALASPFAVAQGSSLFTESIPAENIVRCGSRVFSTNAVSINFNHVTFVGMYFGEDEKFSDELENYLNLNGSVISFSDGSCILVKDSIETVFELSFNGVQSSSPFKELTQLRPFDGKGVTVDWDQNIAFKVKEVKEYAKTWGASSSFRNI